MLRQSFLQRQIEALGGALARMLLGRDTLRLEFPAEALPSPERDLQARLLARLTAGDVCGAEDALFDAVLMARRARFHAPASSRPLPSLFPASPQPLPCLFPASPWPGGFRRPAFVMPFFPRFRAKGFPPPPPSGILRP